MPTPSIVATATGNPAFPNQSDNVTVTVPSAAEVGNLLLFFVFNFSGAPPTTLVAGAGSATRIYRNTATENSASVPRYGIFTKTAETADINAAATVTFGFDVGGRILICLVIDDWRDVLTANADLTGYHSQADGLTFYDLLAQVPTDASSLLVNFGFFGDDDPTLSWPGGSTEVLEVSSNVGTNTVSVMSEVVAAGSTGTRRLTSSLSTAGDEGIGGVGVVVSPLILMHQMII